MVFSANEDFGCVGCESRDRTIKRLKKHLLETQHIVEFLCHWIGRMVGLKAQSVLKQARERAPEEVKILGHLDWGDKGG